MNDDYIPLTRAFELVSRAYADGMRQFEDDINGDKFVNRSEAVRWMKRRGYTAKHLRELVETGRVRQVKTGESQSSPFKYLRSDIRRALLSLDTIKCNVL